jgi:hypothetical protein
MYGFDQIDIIPQFSRDRFILDNMIFYFSLDHHMHADFYMPNHW